MAGWLALIVISVSCDGPKGDVGPVGPQGPKGDSGVAGQNGTDGIGAREIITGPVKSTNGGYTLGKANLSTEDSVMISKSVVVVFIKSQGLWWSQPGIVQFGNDRSTTFNFVTLQRNRLFYVDIRPVSWSEADKSKAPEREFESIRAVIIPTETFRMNAEVDWTDYEEVVSTLGLKESNAIKAD